MSEEPKQLRPERKPRLLGLRCDTLTKQDVEYIVFYDIDTKNISQDDIKFIDDSFKHWGISYLLYQTKNGFHIVGLSPLSMGQWCTAFTTLKNRFGSYYGGIVIRVSRKPLEQQVLITIHEEYGYVIPNLYNLYVSRFPQLKRKPWVKELSKHVLVFERYRSDK